MMNNGSIKFQFNNKLYAPRIILNKGVFKSLQLLLTEDFVKNSNIYVFTLNKLLKKVFGISFLYPQKTN